MRGERGDLAFDLARVPKVVSVEVGDVQRIRHLRAEIAGRGDSGVRHLHDAHCRMVLGNPLGDLRGGVGRTVVDHQYV